ncbi:MAG: hypothetical protein IPN51_17580 [Chloracidobacterium sp.]|nr:hypothetical protein [Chloracidobacterium sp.]
MCKKRRYMGRRRSPSNDRGRLGSRDRSVISRERGRFAGNCIPPHSEIIVSSTAGQRGKAGYSNYAAKGQISLAKALFNELAPSIRVNAVARMRSIPA